VATARLLDEPPRSADRFRGLKETFEACFVEIRPTLGRRCESPFVVLRLETKPPVRELAVETDARRIGSSSTIGAARPPLWVVVRAPTLCMRRLDVPDLPGRTLRVSKPAVWH
jgi:hypothetical protein